MHCLTSMKDCLSNKYGNGIFDMPKGLLLFIFKLATTTKYVGICWFKILKSHHHKQ